MIWGLASSVWGMPEFWFGFAIGAAVSAIAACGVCWVVADGLLHELTRTRKELENAQEILRRLKGPK